MILQKPNESLSDAFFRWHLEFEEDLTHNRKDAKTIQTYSHVVKRFTTIVEASRWVDFMSGLRMNLSGRKDGV